MFPNGVIQEIDGSMWIKRRNNTLETFMDKYFIRWPNELRWSHKEDIDLSIFKNKHKDLERCYIIGKGPSLDRITLSHFVYGLPIFCCNESIHKIESLGEGLIHDLYVVQQDATLKGTCVPKDKDKVIQFISNNAKGISHNEKARGYLPALLGLNGNSLTVEVCLCLAKHMGIDKAILYGFDSCITKNTDYAKTIGYPSGSKGLKPERFLSHKKKIESRAKILGIEITFLEITQSSSCIPEHLQHSH